MFGSLQTLKKKDHHHCLGKTIPKPSSQKSSQMPSGIQLKDLPTLDQRMHDDVRVCQRREAELHDAIHSLVRKLQKQLAASASRSDRSEQQNAELLAENETLRNSLEGCRMKLQASDREVSRMKNDGAFISQEMAELQERVAAREATVREQMRLVADREEKLRQDEADVSSRMAAFDASLEPRQAKLNAETDHAQSLRAQAQRLMDEASRVSETAATRRIEAERIKRHVEESSSLQMYELAERQRLLQETISEREMYVEQRLSACSALETRLRQWASDINAELAGHASVRETQLEQREERLSASLEELSIRERQLVDAQRKLEGERQELMHILQDGVVGIEGGASVAGDDRQRLLQRLRRIRSLLENGRRSASVESLRVTQIGNDRSATIEEHGSLGTSVASTYAQIERRSGRELLDAQNSNVASCVVSRGTSSDSITASPVAVGCAEEQDRHSQLFRLPSDTTLHTSPWAAQRETGTARNLSVGDAAPQYFPGSNQRLQRSPPERRVITSPLKLNKGETKGTNQNPLS
jgi:hypothetical protein